MATKVKVTKADALKVFAAVKKAYKPWIAAGYEPQLVKDWDWANAPYAIIWEGGPYDWAYGFPYGGRDQEFGGKIPNVSDAIPNTVFCEPYAGWALCIYDNS